MPTPAVPPLIHAVEEELTDDGASLLTLHSLAPSCAVWVPGIGAEKYAKWLWELYRGVTAEPLANSVRDRWRAIQDVVFSASLTGKTEDKPKPKERRARRKAANDIQARIRGRKARKEREEMRQAAVFIQTRSRGHLTRVGFKGKRASAVRADDNSTVRTSTGRGDADGCDKKDGECGSEGHDNGQTGATSTHFDADQGDAAASEHNLRFDTTASEHNLRFDTTASESELDPAMDNKPRPLMKQRMKEVRNTHGCEESLDRLHGSEGSLSITTEPGLRHGDDDGHLPDVQTLDMISSQIYNATYDQAAAAHRRPRIYPIWQRKQIFRAVQEDPPMPSSVPSPLRLRAAASSHPNFVLCTPNLCPSLQSARTTSDFGYGPTCDQMNMRAAGNRPTSVVVEREDTWIQRCHAHSGGPPSGYRRPRTAQSTVQRVQATRKHARHHLAITQHQGLSSSVRLRGALNGFSGRQLTSSASFPALGARPSLPRTQSKVISPAWVAVRRIGPKPPPFTVACPPRLHSAYQLGALTAPAQIAPPTCDTAN